MSDWPSLSQPTPSRMVAHRLRRAIRAGEYKVGDRLPSQRELATTYRVAQNTAREALRLLAEEGLVVAQHGRGVFVTAPFALPDGAPAGYLSGPVLDPSEIEPADHFLTEPVSAMAGQLFLGLRNTLAEADWVDAWRVTENRLVIEWNGGPTIQAVVEWLLPRCDEGGSTWANGVPGLRLVRQDEGEAELAWLNIPGSKALLRRLTL